MNSVILQNYADVKKTPSSMQELGDVFIESLPTHISKLKIPARSITEEFRSVSTPAQIDHVEQLQGVMHDVLCHPITQEAQTHAEDAFEAFLEKEKTDSSVLSFFNGWNETHRTTSLVSAKVIMRLSADAVHISQEDQSSYHIVLAHMHEVTKDDFGLGQNGHDGMYKYMASAFGASAWVDDQYKVKACDEFSEFLYETGVSAHKSAMNSHEHRQSLVDAMMVSVASELWNGREYNYLSQFIKKKLLSVEPSLSTDTKALRNAKGYVLGHSGEVENRHGLHALAAAQNFSRYARVNFDMDRLKNIMINYNKRVGKAFFSLRNVLTDQEIPHRCKPHRFAAIYPEYSETNHRQ
ncbi:MAG: hypothetical protein P8011_12020 [Acidihalobacter sp.]|uniref:hypothetical protein n=1 Tax=Acidihalobacter sp. TaxID=1872108 RepID=UPI00307E8BC1